MLAALALVAAASSACGGNATSNGSQDEAKAQASAAGLPAGTLLARITGVELEVPKGWKLKRDTDKLTLSAAPGAYGASGDTSPGGGIVTSATTVSADTEVAAGKALGVLQGQGTYSHVKRLPDVTIHGVRLYHLQAQTNLLWHDEYGAVTGGRAVIIDWDFNNIVIDRAGVAKLVGKVMPTVRVG